MNNSKNLLNLSVRFIILLGIVSLFADMTYESARSITGPYLAVLGASATLVGFISGLGELLGYGLRLFSGILSDKTKKYWSFTIIGYTVNLLAVPMLALAGNWWFAAILIITERVGKAIRVPPRDAILSHAAHQTGQGWGFGIHEALDQIGALLGPIIVSIVLYFKGGYKESFAILLIPALFALITLIIARMLYPNPSNLEIQNKEIKTKGLPEVFWFYLAAIGLIALGYADFPLIAYHFEKISLLSAFWIPIFYAIAMGTDAIAALVFGKLFDKIGIIAMIWVSLISAFFAPLVFLGGFSLALLGVSLWGIGMGAQESIMRAAVAKMVSPAKRGSAYGIFGLGYGLLWFLGSTLMGYLYDISIPFLIALSISAQLASIPLFIFIKAKYKK
jgi:MFS family permease